MRPVRLLRLHAAQFGSLTACLGTQLATVIDIVDEIVPELCWYAADVQTVGAQFPEWKQPVPVRVIELEGMTGMIRRVEQFESGVFAGVPKSIGDPVFRDGGSWTEDEDLADLGDSVVEIRAFDTSYIMLASSDAAIVERIARRLPANGRSG